LNRAKFREKWKDLLSHEHLANNKRNIERAAHRTPETAVVVFDDLLPTPDLDAGSARMASILKILRKQHRTLFVYKSKNPAERYEQALWAAGIETLDLVNYRQRLKEQEFHTAIVSRPDLAHVLVPSLRRQAPKMKIIYDPVDAHYRRLDREYQLLGDANIKNQAERYRKIELELVRATDMLWSASAADAKLLTTEVPEKPVAIIPTIHPLHPSGKRFAERHNLIFIGNFNHRPNSDAIIFFVEQVLPLIRRSIPEVGFDVVGSNTPTSFQSYASENLRIHGYVPDIDPLFNSSRVFVAPLRFGAGVNGKIGEALSYGLPVVTN
jgi:glycosyltransferase involved in cell wall biosynthesis